MIVATLVGRDHGVDMAGNLPAGSDKRRSTYIVRAKPFVIDGVLIHPAPVKLGPRGKRLYDVLTSVNAGGQDKPAL